jgi:hypothetical protein
MEEQYVFSGIGTEILNIIWINFVLQTVHRDFCSLSRRLLGSFPQIRRSPFLRLPSALMFHNLARTSFTRRETDRSAVAMVRNILSE